MSKNELGVRIVKGKKKIKTHFEFEILQAHVCSDLCFLTGRKPCGSTTSQRSMGRLILMCTELTIHGSLPNEGLKLAFTGS